MGSREGWQAILGVGSRVGWGSILGVGSRGGALFCRSRDRDFRNQHIGLVYHGKFLVH